MKYRLKSSANKQKKNNVESKLDKINKKVLILNKTYD
jgi:hypothetical protein